ncbi:hypothetical protein ACLBW0_23920 [Enterobacteriaceae bacterium C34A]
MPVWLDAIPKKAKKIPRPSMRRWLIFLGIIIIAGVSVTLLLWDEERTGVIFWFSALGLPICVWGLIFGLRRFAYKVEQIAAESRNMERERLIGEEILRGQRCAWILGTHVEVSAGSKVGELLTVINRAETNADTSQPRGCKKPVRYAALTDFQTCLFDELKSTVSKLTTRIEVIVAPLPKSLPCWMMLDCDDDIFSRAKEQLEEEILQKTGRNFRLMPERGINAFDIWLDNRWDKPGILVSITISLPATPDEGDADAIVLVVLSNRKALAYSDALKLHRPEKGSNATLTKTLSRALLWAKIKSNVLQGSWISGPLLINGSGWNNACEKNEVEFSLSEENTSIDPVLGFARHAAPWIAITLADASYEQRGVQVIAAQPAADKDEVWVTVITKETDRKEIPGNV